jgi:hypothetical protein
MGFKEMNNEDYTKAKKRIEHLLKYYRNLSDEEKEELEQLEHSCEWYEEYLNRKN